MSGAPPLQPIQDATTSLPPHMVPPLQFLHVPGRPQASRSSPRARGGLGKPLSLGGSGGQLQPPTKVPVPVYSLNRLPSASQMASFASASLGQRQSDVSSPLSSIPGSRPPTAPTQEWFSKDVRSARTNSAAHTSRMLFRQSAPSSATSIPGGAQTTISGASDPQVPPTAHGSSTKGSPHRLAEDVSWTDRSPRVASGIKRQAPPLAYALQGHLDRELKFLQNAADRDEAEMQQQPTASGVVDPMERLQPHREAMRMLAEGLPSYASLIHNIMGAYDAAIKNQAQVTAAARVISNTAVEVRLSHEAEVVGLKETIESVETRYRTVHSALQAKLAEAKTNGVNAVLSNIEKENLSLRQAIGEQEMEKTSDLEKMMTLIVAIKECDARVKSLEDSLQEARSQLDEMKSLKKMMGESQLELGQLKFQYKDSVPLSRYTNATKELEAQLLESRRETKRVRRLCIARGSAIDGLEKKLKAATDELDRFRMVAGSKQVRDALTPRPDWVAIHAAVPELKDFALDVPIEMIDGTALQPRLVGGLSETSLQVGFLADKIVELQQQLATATAAGSQTTSPSKLGGSSPPAADINTSGISKHRQSLASIAPAAAVLSTTASTIAIPLLALGSAAWAPHLKEVGAVPRVSLDKAKVRSMLHDFYVAAQKKYAGDTEMLTPPSTVEIVKQFLAFSTVLFATNPDVRQLVQGNAVYLVYNLYDEARKPSPLPQVVLFKHVMDGTMPLRIALEALRLEDELQQELNALCEAHKSKRLRKFTVLELVVPLLSFKSKDEIEELRSALGVESTVDVSALTLSSSKFMTTLFEQEILEGMKLYGTVVEKLSAMSSIQEGVRCVTTAAVLDVVAEVEPHTDQRVIDALIRGDVTEESVFPLEHTLHALRSAPLVRSAPPGGTKQ